MYDRLDARLRSYGHSRQSPPPFVVDLQARRATDEQIHDALDAFEEDYGPFHPEPRRLRRRVWVALGVAAGFCLGLLLV